MPRWLEVVCGGAQQQEYNAVFSLQIGAIFMTLLVIGLIVFIGIHSITMSPALRQTLVNRLDLKGYKLLFSAAAALGLVLIIIGKAKAGFVHVYTPPSWGRHPAMLLMLFAFILLPAAHMPGNIKRFTRHPMLWGVVLWSVAHLLANGDKASLILFGSLGLYSLVDMVSANRRGASLQTQRLPLRKDMMVVGAGLVVYFIFLVLHPYLFGPVLIPGLYFG